MDRGGENVLVPSITAAYRGAASSNACSAASSSRPLRHHPGQSRAIANVFFALVSSATGTVGMEAGYGRVIGRHYGSSG